MASTTAQCVTWETGFMAPALCQRRDGLQRLLPARPVPLAQQVGLTLQRPFDSRRVTFRIVGHASSLSMLLLRKLEAYATAALPAAFRLRAQSRVVAHYLDTDPDRPSVSVLTLKVQR